MSISGIASYANTFYGIDPAYARSRRDDDNGATGNGGRNIGPDTVSLSAEAMEKYHSMKNNSEASATADDNSSKSYMNGSQKNQKMTQADILAFLKSDTFSQDAMGYVKSAASDNKTASGDDDDSSDMLIHAMEKNKSENVKNDAADSDIASLSAKDSGKTFLNGKRATEKELAVAIAKTQQEANDLTATYEQILSGEGTEEEKNRLSQPVYKQLKDKLEELAGLKAQAQGLANEKFTAMKSA